MSSLFDSLALPGFDDSARLPSVAPRTWTEPEHDDALAGSDPADLLVGLNPEQRAAVEATGATVLELPADAQGRVSIPALLHAMHTRGQMRALVEGGAELAGAFFDHRLVDRLMLFVAPILLGGRDARPLVAGEGVHMVADALRASDMRVEVVEGDLLVHAVFDTSLHA